jgi:hypothetical protein
MRFVRQEQTSGEEVWVNTYMRFVTLEQTSGEEVWINPQTATHIAPYSYTGQGSAILYFAASIRSGQEPNKQEAQATLVVQGTAEQVAKRFVG